MLDKKIFLISHIADPDGATPVILAKLAFKNLEYSLVELREVDDTLESLFDKIDDYDEIHIVDLNVTPDMALRIDSDEKLKTKIKVFDHHVSQEFLNKFSFISVIDEKNGRKESGTSNYYTYLKTLCDDEDLNKDSVSSLVNHVRAIDTYDFNEIPKEEARKIDFLFGIYGREGYITHFLDFVKSNDKFNFTETDELLIKLENQKLERYLESKSKEMMKAKLDGYKVGIVYAERFRSDLGHFLASKYEDLDFVILINVSRSVSYRSNDKADLSVFTSKYNGGGHKNAAGSPLPPDLLQNITKLIFKDVEFIEVEN